MPFKFRYFKDGVENRTPADVAAPDLARARELVFEALRNGLFDRVESRDETGRLLNVAEVRMTKAPHAQGS